MKPRLKGVSNLIKLSKIFRKINPHIIHSYNYSDDYSEALTAKLSGIKWVYTKKNMGWGSNAWKVRTKLSDAIIPQNQEMIDIFFGGMKKNFLIPIGIDTNEFTNISRDKCLIKKLGLENSYPIILTIANIIPIKGIDILIKGFELALEDFPDAKLVIVGEDKTSYAEKLKESVKEIGLYEKVVFTGKQDDIKQFFGAADIFILSSMKTGEGGPISVLEAMSSGILSFGSDVPGIRDQFREFQDQLFESENPGSLANKIIFAMRMSGEEKSKRLELQKDFIRKNYSIESEVRQLENLYIKLVNS
jgi:glycosyltransferase involved in cell wall biosynthesis